MQKFTQSILALLLPALALAQNGPIDFEAGGYGATWTWTVFENAANPALEIIANPDPTGLNTSATVAKFTALQAGNPWAGCETSHGAGTGSFLIDSSNYLIRIMVWKSEISDVGIKLVRPDSWSTGEIKVANTKINEWEQLTFDFSSHMAYTDPYDQLVVFPDFQTRGSDQVVYFDNVFSDAATIGLEEEQENLARLFPNPGKNAFTIVSEATVQELLVYSVNGELMHKEAIHDQSALVQTNDWKAGVYVIQVIGESQTETIRWVKN